MRFFKKNYGLLIVLFLSFWAIRPFLVPGFFPMHDDTQVARVFEMGKVLRDGVFPVRVVPDLGYGYGYPIFNFYAPLAYYVGAAFMFLGFDALIGTKLMMALGVVLAGIFMYFLAREFFGEFGGIVSGLFYLYSPYHAVDIYVRGDVAEFWAYAFIPLTFLGFYKVFRELKSHRVEINNSKLQFKIQNFGIIGSLGFAGIILSHNLTALMVAPFLFVAILLFIIFSDKETRIFNTLYLILYIFLGLAISAFYWIPALVEMKYTNVLSQIGGGADFRDHFVCIGQLWNSLWGFGGSVAGCTDGLSFKIGKLHIFSVFASILVLIYLKLKHKYLSYIYYLSIFSIVSFFVSIFLTLDISKFLWKSIPIMAFFQYPWRFLIMASFFSSFLAGFVVWFFKKTAVSVYSNTLMCCSIIILIFSLLFFNLKFFVPQTFFPAVSKDFTNETALKWIASKTSDEYLPPNFKKPNNPKDVYRGQVNIQVQETLVQKVSNIVSFVGLLALFLGIILFRDRKNHKGTVSPYD